MRPIAKRLSAFLLFLGLMAAAAPVSAADTAKIGDPDGEAFTAGCGPGEALIGFNYTASETLMGIAALCVDYADGEVTSGAKQSESYGLEGGAGQDPVFCPKDRPLVAGIMVNLNANTRVHSVRVTCDLPSNGKGGLLLKASATTGGTAVSKKSVTCGVDGFATGLIGTMSGGVQSLGLRCNDPNGNAAAATPDAGEDGEGAEALRTDPPGGRTRVAAEPTTIYAGPAGDEIAYLQEGDTVAIVNCEDDGAGWCRINKPTAGYVWGGDLE